MCLGVRLKPRSRLAGGDRHEESFYSFCFPENSQSTAENPDRLSSEDALELVVLLLVCFYCEALVFYTVNRHWNSWTEGRSPRPFRARSPGRAGPHVVVCHILGSWLGLALSGILDISCTCKYANTMSWVSNLDEHLHTQYIISVLTDCHLKKDCSMWSSVSYCLHFTQHLVKSTSFLPHTLTLSQMEQQQETKWNTSLSWANLWLTQLQNCCIHLGWFKYTTPNAECPQFHL